MREKLTVKCSDLWSLLNELDCPLMLRYELGKSTRYLVYLDFIETIYPDAENTTKCFEQLAAKVESDLSFSGWIGFWGYEFLAAHFGVQCKSRKDLDIPDGLFARPSSLLVWENDSLTIESTSSERAREIHTRSLSVKKRVEGEHQKEGVHCNLSLSEYRKIFEQAKEHILDGDTYQIKISQRFSSKQSPNPIFSFAKLMESNPSPEAFLLKWDNFSLVSCSPEKLLLKKANKLFTKPIAGTYDIQNSAEDVMNAFLQDEKEMSEHNMIVDLERNDLSIVCKAGSVQPTQFRKIEKYSHLYHMVSLLEGELREETTLSKIVQSIFPGGSITGCPKRRTMELIDRFEVTFRGPYTGSFGLLYDNGDIDMNIIIRTLLLFDEHCYVQAGGGIVIDSTAEYEYNENTIKAQALLDLLK